MPKIRIEADRMLVKVFFDGKEVKGLSSCSFYASDDSVPELTMTLIPGFDDEESEGQTAPRSLEDICSK